MRQVVAAVGRKANSQAMLSDDDGRFGKFDELKRLKLVCGLQSQPLDVFVLNVDVFVLNVSSTRSGGRFSRRCR